MSKKNRYIKALENISEVYECKECGKTFDEKGKAVNHYINH